MATEIRDLALNYLGIGVANAIAIFDPDMVVIGGGVSKAGQVVFDKVQEVVVYLNTDIDRDFVKSEIEKYYKFSDGVEDSFLNYYSDDKKIRVVYQITSNLIQYIKR